MSLGNGYQLQTMNRMMKESFCTYPIQSITSAFEKQPRQGGNLGIENGKKLVRVDFIH